MAESAPPKLGVPDDKARGSQIKGKQFRDSMKVNQDQMNKQRMSIQDTIKRASERFKGASGDTGALVIENERLKTSIMVLTQKLQAIEHTNDSTKKLEVNERKFKHEADDLGQKVKMLEAEVSDQKCQF